MRKLIQLIALSAVVLTLSLPAFAQQPTASPSPAATQDDPAAQAALYQKVLDNYKSNQPVAYEAAKEFLQKYPNYDPKVITYLQTFVTKYEQAIGAIQLPKLIDEKKYTEAFALGKQILAKKPDDLNVMMRLASAGYLASSSKNEGFNAEAINHAKQAIQLIESGKTPENWEPFKNKDDALAYLSFTLGYLNMKNNSPNEAVAYFVKSVQSETPIKKEPSTYYYLARSYDIGPYKKQSDEFKTRFPADAAETPESKAALENLNQLVDRLIDAYARAVAYAGTDPKNQAVKTEAMTRLTELYKFRHEGKDDGLPAYIAGIMATPLPQPPTAPTTTTAPTTPAGTTSATDGGATPAATPATGTTTPTATPASTTQPATTTPATTPSTTPSTTTQPSDNKPATTPTPATPAPTPKP